MLVPVSALYGAFALIGVLTLMFVIFSVASAMGLVFHSCSGGSDFYCNTCPGQYHCPGIEFGDELKAKMEKEKGEYL